MQQPKFKFGDKIQHTDNDPAVIVSEITYVVTNSDGSGEYRYNGRYWESESGLYQEPQKKKAYAWVSGEGWIQFTIKEEIRVYGTSIKWMRAPEYDIEYKD